MDHTGVKEFRCSNCGREFRHAQYLKNHQKRCTQQTQVFSSLPVDSNAPIEHEAVHTTNSSVQ